MALTRALLKGLQLTDEQVSAIIEAHTESTDSLKAQRDQYKEAAEKYTAASAELERLKADSGDVWKKKFEEEHSAFESYKTAQDAALAKATKDFEDYKTAETNKAIRTQKDTAYRDLLKKQGIAEKRIDTVMKTVNLDDVKLNKDGSITDAEKVAEGIKTEWADFISAQHTAGADVETPPASGKDTVTKEQFDKMSYAERVKLYSDNPELYNILRKR